MIRRSTLLICGFILIPALASAQDFTGLGDGVTFNDPANWVGGVLPIGNADIGPGFNVVLNSNQSFNELDVVGDQNSTPGTASIDVQGGTITGGGWIKVGVDVGNDGTYTQSGGTYTGHTQFHIGDNGTGVAEFSGTANFSSTQNTDIGTGTGTGTLDLSGSAVVDNQGGSINLGNNGTGTLNIADTSTLNTDQINVANATGTGTVNQTGGTINANNWVALGQGSTGVPVYNHSAGTLNVGLVSMGEALTVGENATGTYNASGTADINAPFLLVGRNAGGDGLLEITGSSVAIDLAQELRVGLQSGAGFNDAGASGELSYIADAGGVSTIFADATQFGAMGTQDLTVDLTGDANFSTFTSFTTGPLMDIAVLVDNSGMIDTDGDGIDDALAPVIGTFSGLLEGAAVDIGGGQTAFITYTGGDGNDIVLQTFSSAVPEPSSLAILALAGIGMMTRRRRS